MIGVAAVTGFSNCKHETILGFQRIFEVVGLGQHRRND